MEYIKVTIRLQPDQQDFREIVIATLGENGFESFVEQDQHLEAFIQSGNFNKTLLNGSLFEPLFSFDWNIETIADQNWNEVWEKNYFQPLVIGDNCVIRAPFHTDYPSAKYELVIEPNMAFGTGNHETTTLMIEQLLSMELEGKKVLDMGCGTGVLAMLASKRGATELMAIDIDQWAYEGTLENCRINQCSNITVMMGDSSLLGHQTFDLILANIHKNVLLNDVHKYSEVLNPGGILIMSGFYDTDLSDISDAALEAQLHPFDHQVRNKWVAAVYQKK
jgi:ribosomal protein L11 methyltransferase